MRKLQNKLGIATGVETVLKIFNLFGLWPSEHSSVSRWSSWIYGFYGLSVVVIFLFLFDTSLFVAVFFLDAIEEITSHLCLSLTLIALFGKILNFKFFCQRIRNLLREGEEFELENEDETNFVREKMSFFNKLTWFLFVSANISNAFNSMAAFIAGGDHLPLLAWFPFDWRSNYVSLSIYQVIGLFIQTNLNVSTDLFAAYLMYVASIRLELLGARLVKLGKFEGKGRWVQPDQTKSLVQCAAFYNQICT